MGEASREGFGEVVVEEVEERFGNVEARCSSRGDDGNADWREFALTATDASPEVP